MLRAALTGKCASTARSAQTFFARQTNTTATATATTTKPFAVIVKHLSRPAQHAFTQKHAMPGWKSAAREVRQRLWLPISIGTGTVAGAFVGGCYLLARRRREKLATKSMRSVIAIQQPTGDFAHPYNELFSWYQKVAPRYRS